MNLAIQAAEIARVAEMLAPLCDGDESLFHDMMTGESPIDRVIARLWEQIARDNEMLAGIKERQSSLQDRRKRIEGRIDAGKAAIGQILRAAQLPKLELPEATFSVRDGKPSLRVVDPDAVPAQFQRSKPEPDKTAINEAFAQTEGLPNWLVREPARDVVSVRVK